MVIMKVLDLDMDYFMNRIATGIPETTSNRLRDGGYESAVWSREQVVDFLENNLGLSRTNRIPGRVVSGHNEALYFWRELIDQGLLHIPFEVVHIDSHADMGLGSDAEYFLRTELLGWPVNERPLHSYHTNCYGRCCAEGIGDYLLYAVAYRWISKLTYCANPHGAANDYDIYALKGFCEKLIFTEPVENTIQLLYNPENLTVPRVYNSEEKEIEDFIASCRKEPEVPYIIIPTIGAVSFNGDFNFAVMAQSPNYTPQNADFIMDVFREYIDEI